MTEPNHILLVEDNEDDAELTMLAFQHAHILNPIVRVKDGIEALDYLFGTGAYAGRDVRDAPAVVLLDLNLPRLSGLEVLAAIRASEPLRHLPVVILTSMRALSGLPPNQPSRTPPSRRSDAAQDPGWPARETTNESTEKVGVPSAGRTTVNCATTLANEVFPHVSPFGNATVAENSMTPPREP